MESAAGETFYVPLPGAAADSLLTGDIVRVSSGSESWVKPTDRVLARFAAGNGGVYDPDAHAKDLERLAQGTSAADSPSPVEFVAANVRRLQRLANYGLVALLPDGRWRVPVDLVKQLEERQRSTPNQAINVRPVAPPLSRQTGHIGPTWLDRQPPAEQGRAPFGFGAAVSAAARQRTQFVRSLGIEPAASDARARLERLEVEHLGQVLSRELGLTFNPAREGMRGRVSRCSELPSGNSYVYIVDETSRRLTVVPAPGRGERFEGREVEVTGEASGRLSLRTRPDRSRGGSP